jgi:hypothetical protein
MAYPFCQQRRKLPDNIEFAAPIPGPGPEVARGECEAYSLCIFESELISLCKLLRTNSARLRRPVIQFTCGR